MRFALRRPAGPLAGLVQQLWFYEGYVKPHAKERLLPDGSMELVINMSEDEVRVWDRHNLTRFERLDGAAIVGPRSEYFVIDTAEQRSVLGVHFYPGGAYPFVGVPADALQGVHVSLGELWGGFARELRERLLAEESIEARFDLLEAALLSRASRPLALHPTVRFAMREFRNRPGRGVSEVCEDTGLSQRRFIEVFRQQVGLAPKQYCRVQRFQRIIQTSPERGPVDWASVAADLGYCDQSHLIHDFRAIAGISPGVWEGLRTEHRSHVPLSA